MMDDLWKYDLSHLDEDDYERVKAEIEERDAIIRVFEEDAEKAKC
jgi:hypothetical protein